MHTQHPRGNCYLWSADQRALQVGVLLNGIGRLDLGIDYYVPGVWRWNIEYRLLLNGHSIPLAHCTHLRTQTQPWA